MNRKNEKFLAYAVALAASFAIFPGSVYAAEETAAAAVSAAQPADDGKQSSAENAAPVDARTKDWGKNRPQEDAVEASMKQYEGKTIVDTVFEGTTSLTEGTAKAALTMRTGDMFTAAGLMKDRDAIYNTGYFYDLFPTFEEVPEGVVITYHVLENPILSGVEIKGNTVEPDEVLYGLVTMKTGEIINSRTLQENVQAIQDQYRKDGYILAKITDMNINSAGKLILKINEGTLEGYKVKGNTKTKDYVILREMRQKPGEPFNSKQARRSMQRVYNLGFFEDVNIKMNPGVEPNAVVMELDVKEKQTGSFGIGAGYSTADGVIGMVSIGDTNFRGTGDAVSLTYQASGGDTDARGYTFSYRRPWLDAKETAGTFRVYNRTYEYTDYNTDGDRTESYMRKYSGGEITLSRPVSEYSTNYLTLRNRNDSYVRHTENGTSGDRKGTAWEKENFGTTRSITLEHVTDTRDNIYNPTEGGRISLSGEIGGFGGDFNFQKATVEEQHYKKAGRSQVFALRGQYGMGFGHISEFNQYKLGGQNSLRGYRDDQFRGNRMMLATLEYRFPLVTKVQGALFTDWGAAWEDGFLPSSGTIHGSFGIGLGLNTPLGPLRLDYGYGRDGGRVHFSVGSSF